MRARVIRIGVMGTGVMGTGVMGTRVMGVVGVVGARVMRGVMRGVRGWTVATDDHRGATWTGAAEFGHSPISHA